MSARTTPARLWLRSLGVWLALVVLLALTLWGAFLPIGGWNLPLALTVSAVQAGLVVVIFMGLGQAGGASRIAALCGVLWVALLISLVMTDLSTRQEFSPGFDGDANPPVSDAQR